jgi:ABC-type lipoprotein release transport system permease subunit
LISHLTTTKIASVAGIDPVREDEMTGLKKRLTAGEFLDSHSTGALVSEGLARLLHVWTGDSIVIYGQGYQGVTAAAIVPVQGIVQYPLPELNNSMVYLSLGFAQQLYSAQDRLTAAAILLENSKALDATAAAIRKKVDASKEVMTWKQMMPELVQGMDVNDGGTVLMLLILYVVIGFGIFGTVMMMTVERTREFGILVSIGMKRWRLIFITVIESILVSSVGLIVGVIVSFPPVYYFYLHPVRLGGDYAQAMLAYGFEPIVPMSIDPIIFIIQGLSVFGLGVLSAIYPLIVIRSLRPVRAMRA